MFLAWTEVGSPHSRPRFSSEEKPRVFQHAGRQEGEDETQSLHQDCAAVQTEGNGCTSVWGTGFLFHFIYKALFILKSQSATV